MVFNRTPASPPRQSSIKELSERWDEHTARYVLTTTKDSAAPVLSFGNGHLLGVVAIAETIRTSSLRRQRSSNITEPLERWGDIDVVLDLHRGTESSPLLPRRTRDRVPQVEHTSPQHEQYSLPHAGHTARVNKYHQHSEVIISEPSSRRLLMR